MPDEWGYPPTGVPQGSSMLFSCTWRTYRHILALTDIPRNTGAQGAIAHPNGSVPRRMSQSHPTADATTVPTCRYPNCHRHVNRDERTQEFTEYCSLDHMLFVVVSWASGPSLVLNVALWVSRDDLRRGVPPCTACNERPRRINGNYCGSSCERWDAQRQQQHQQYYPPSGPPPGNVTRGGSFPTSPKANNQYPSPGHPPVEST
jgi:hypothetical protein